MRSTPRLFLRSCVVFFASAMIGSAYGASSVPSYTAIDLGVANGDSFSNPTDTGFQGFTLSNTGATGTLTTPSGAVYAFPRTDNLVSNPQSLLAEFPPFTNAPVGASTTYGDPNNAYSHFSNTNVFLNQVGEFVATDLVGVSGHIQDAQSIVFGAVQKANGSFGPLVGFWSTLNNTTSGGQVAWALDLNNSGQLLGVDAGTSPYQYTGLGTRDFFLYNANTGVRTELSSLLPVGWISAIPIALDDQGRILVEAEQAPGPNVPYSNNLELLLLTPAGLPSNPIPAPEPTTFVMLAVVGIGLAVRRRWKS